MAQNEIDFSGKTPDELDAIIKAAEKAKERARGPQTLAVIGAFVAAHKWLCDNEADSISDQITGIAQQAMPKGKVFARRFGMSETELHNALEKGRKAVAGL